MARICDSIRAVSLSSTDALLRAAAGSPWGHELGHHLLRDDFSSEWIIGTDGDDRERLIDAFVIHFLMPRDAVLSRWNGLLSQGNPRQAAISLGVQFGLSWTAVIAQLCNLELIDDGTRTRLDLDRPRKADYLEAGLTVREAELAAPLAPPSLRSSRLACL